MALADIIQKIESDASEQAAVVLANARSKADAVVLQAQQDAQARLVDATKRAETNAKREAHIIAVNGRLESRDIALSTKRTVLDATYEAVKSALIGLSDDEYASVLARKIVVSARGGESVAFGFADTGQAQNILAKVRQLDESIDVHMSAQPAPFEHGALLKGESTSVDLSLETIIEESRRELDPVLAQILFSEK